jgi:hypothetical protein
MAAWTKLLDADPVAVRSRNPFFVTYVPCLYCFLDFFIFISFFYLFLSLFQFVFCFSLNFTFCFSVLHIIQVLFTCFIHNIPLLRKHGKSVLTFSPSMPAPIMGPCIGVTVMWFILRLGRGRVLSYSSWGVKTWAESKMLEIARFPLSKIHTSSGLPLQKHIGSSHSEPRTKFTTYDLTDSQPYERYPGETPSQIKRKILIY